MRKLIVISLDAVVEEDLAILGQFPVFRNLLKNGAKVNHFRSIYPSYTYPCHTTMATGNYPNRHGILSNAPRRVGTTNPAWLWDHKYVKCRDIFDAAKEKGLTTAAVGWPVSGNHPNIDYEVDEIYPYEYPVRDAAANRDVYLKSGTTVELYDKCVGPHINMRVIHHQPESLFFLTDVACDIIREYKPDILMIHVTNVDHYRHVAGLYNQLVTDGLVESEQCVTQIINATKDAGTYEDTDFVITSDHGQMDYTRTGNPNVFLAENGFIDVDKEGNVTDYRAWVYPVSMSAHVVLKNPEDMETKKAVFRLLDENKEKLGISKVYTAEEVNEQEGLAGDLSFVLETDNETNFGGKWTGEYWEPASDKKHATHGYHPDKGPWPIFIGFGPDFKPGARIEEARLVDGAPTYAKILGLNLGETDGKPLLDLLIE